MYCKICTKANEIFKILHSVDILVYKNTKWPTCVYMIKNITKYSGDVFLSNDPGKNCTILYCSAALSFPHVETVLFSYQEFIN